MSANTIKVSITFSFKGETFSPFTIIDLDLLMKQSEIGKTEQNSVPTHIYPLLAASADIDTYSYAYEIMQAADAVYSEPTGMATKYLIEGQFDYQAFRKEWLENENMTIVQNIADKHRLEIDFHEQSELRDALLEAFFEGKKFSGKND